MNVDPITTEVVGSRLREIASSMEYALYHSGYSPILRESKDGTAGLTDRDGRVVIIGGGLQYHLLAYEQAVRKVKERYPGERMRPGDSFIVNDPYQAGNAHAPDMVAVTPAFHGTTLVGFGVSIAHKADIGGIVPGSSGAAAREIFHDGLMLPPVRFQSNAGIEEAIEAIIRNNSRVPDMVLGDLRAQVGCTRMGAERLIQLCAEYGADVVARSIEHLLVLTERRLRGELSQWQDASATAEGFLDYDGAVKDRPIRIHVHATKRDGRIEIDFSGCDPQTLGPVNLTTNTARSASLIALVASADPTIPINSGLTGVVDFKIPEGLVVSPKRPATVNHYFPTAHLVYNCVLAALGKLNPARAVAPSGLGSGAISIGYRKARSDKPTVLYELMVTSLGGTSRHDGGVMVHAINHFTPGAPVEIIETEYPIRVRRFDIWCDSAGAGRYRGGIGYVREFEVLEDSVLTVRSSNHRFTAWGLNGGFSPKPSRATLNPYRADREELEPITTRQLAAGDVLRFERSGGGGYGPPQERNRDEVLDDVRNGYISAQSAKMIYGCTFDPADLHNQDHDEHQTSDGESETSTVKVLG
jgi:N-methylhydantoinase B